MYNNKSSDPFKLYNYLQFYLTIFYISCFYFRLKIIGITMTVLIFLLQFFEFLYSQNISKIQILFSNILTIFTPQIYFKVIHMFLINMALKIDYHKNTLHNLKINSKINS